MRRKEVEGAVRRTAQLFPERARDVILGENLYKHTREVTTIAEAAGPDGTVCDLGGGLGVNLLTLRALGHRGRLVLIDRFNEYDEANRMGPFSAADDSLRSHDIEIVAQDFWADARLPLDEGIAHTTTCFDVVEHLPGHPLRQLRELRRLLRPGGTCLISGPNSVSLMKRLRLLSGRHPYTPIEYWLEDPFFEHFREYSRDEYEELLRRSGFDDVASDATATITLCRARQGYHRRMLPATSPVRLALWGLAAVESVVPPLRHTVYAWGVKSET